MKVEVQARVILGVRTACLQCDHRTGAARWRGQPPGPAAERSVRHLVAHRGAPERLGSLAVAHAEHHHAERQHGHSPSDQDRLATTPARLAGSAQTIPGQPRGHDTRPDLRLLFYVRRLAADSYAVSTD